MESAIKQKLNDDLKHAIKDRDKLKCSTIRLLVAAIQNAEIAKRAPLEEAELLGIIAKEVRQRKESIDAFKQGNRQDLVTREEAEMSILQEYMPEQISREEIVAAARQVINEVGAQGPRDKGKVMSQLIPRLKGKADGREINAVVTELLG
ncbi:GatB/YqeY domain-containing protein [Chloroflexota bacterium]